MSQDQQKEEKKSNHVSVVLVKVVLKKILIFKKRSSKPHPPNNFPKDCLFDGTISNQMKTNDGCSESFEEVIIKMSSTLDIVKFNNLVEKYLKKDQVREVKSLLLTLIKRSPTQLESMKLENPALYDSVIALKPNIFTYSMLFKVMQSEIKKAKNSNNQDQSEIQNINEANTFWYDLVRRGEDFTPNIIVLNQYIQIYLTGNQNSNALQLYKEYLGKVNNCQINSGKKFKLIPDRITLVNLERISYKLTQNLIALSKRQIVNNYEMQRLVNQTNEVTQIFLSQKYDGFEEYKEKFENLYKYLIEVSISRYDLQGVLSLSLILFQKFNHSRINYMKQAFTFFYQNILSSQGQVSKIFNIYAELEGKSIQDYLLDFNIKLIEHLFNEENISIDGDGDCSFSQVFRIYMESLQILFRYNSIQGILYLFLQQVKSIPILYKAKQSIQAKKLEVPTKISFPDIHTICLVVKCLIRDKCPNQALKLTEFLKEHCISNEKKEGDLPNIIDLPGNKNENMQILKSMQNVVDLTVFDINTFFLNGIVIELNSRHLYQHAINLYQWMERNTAMNHRPNTSTYNMIILVYGSMEEYAQAKAIFVKMHECWHRLNTQEEYLTQFDEIQQNFQAPRIRNKPIVQTGQYLSQQLGMSQVLGVESEEDVKVQKDPLGLSQPDIQQFKHASDTLQKNLNLQFPPANVNSYISLVNTLNRQRLYDEILKVLKQAEQAVQTARHPILRDDINDLAPLYQSIVKNLLQARLDDVKIQACRVALESLRKKYTFYDMQIYQDCLNYLNSDALNRKKYKDLPKLREEILELVEANRSRLREQQSRKTMSISFNKKMVSNDYSNKLSRSSQIDNKSNDEIIRIDSRTTIDKSNTGDSQFDSDEIGSQKSIENNKKYRFQNSKDKQFKSSLFENSNKMQTTIQIEEMMEDDSPQGINAQSDIMEVSDILSISNLIQPVKIE